MTVAVLLAVQLSVALWEFPAMHVPPCDALTTRCTAAALQFAAPSLFAVHVAWPIAPLTTAFTSAAVTDPSPVRSHEFADWLNKRAGENRTRMPAMRTARCELVWCFIE